jgi:hypothetical protein
MGHGFHGYVKLLPEKYVPCGGFRSHGVTPQKKSKAVDHFSIFQPMVTWEFPITRNPHLFFPIPSGKHTKNYGKSPFLMGQLTINGHFQ